MKDLLVVVDMQNDFVEGALGTPEARDIVPAVTARVKSALAVGEEVVFTRDTHSAIYLQTQEGRKLPIEHCIQKTNGWEIIPELTPYARKVFDKPTFGSLELANYAADGEYRKITLIGLCTDICIVSNAILLKAYLPECEIAVEADCCAGVTPASHTNALEAMKMCQIDVK